MNQNTPNPGLALRWYHPCSLPIEWGSRGCPRTTLNHGGTGHQVWLPVRDGDERSCHPSSGIMINSRGERMTKALERTDEITTDSEQIRSEKPERTDTIYTNFHMCLVEFSHVALEDPLATGVGLWLKLILFIITFDLIWYAILTNVWMLKFWINFIWKLRISQIWIFCIPISVIICWFQLQIFNVYASEIHYNIYNWNNKMDSEVCNLNYQMVLKL